MLGKRVGGPTKAGREVRPLHQHKASQHRDIMLCKITPTVSKSTKNASGAAPSHTKSMPALPQAVLAEITFGPIHTSPVPSGTARRSLQSEELQEHRVFSSISPQPSTDAEGSHRCGEGHEKRWFWIGKW